MWWMRDSQVRWYQKTVAKFLRTCFNFLSCGSCFVVLLVSWADMIAVAGAEAVSICGGPDIPVRLGRLDSL